ncbi:MAG: cell division protein FtsW [Magnetospirillum sp.]|nr:cell division protein FtsW [Magnetospirillum sp.]
MSFRRTDTSTLGRWWWTVDRWSLVALLVLIGIGVLLTMAASPAVAERLRAESFHFVRRQFAFLVPALAVMVAMSLLGPREVRRVGAVAFVVAVAMMALVLVAGVQVKGSVRWLQIGGLSLQPSEFVKPAFAVVAAWMLAGSRADPDFPGRWVAAGLYGVVAVLLLLEPDVGQTLVVTAIFLVEIFLAGLPMAAVGAVGALAVVGGAGAYASFSHVRLRVDRFLHPDAVGGDAYQITTALNAFRHGGVFGVGPGEGRVKQVLPDAHTDFILAVAGEEFGVLLCLLMVVLFALILVRGFSRLLREDNLFVVLAAAGLLTQFGLQALINMASTLRLMPTKGMTLPFISYGGSSLLALAFGMGMALALTRIRYGSEGER